MKRLQAALQLGLSIAVGSAIATTVLFGCAALQHGVEQACTLIDSGNAAIGTFCATEPEIASFFEHAKATRALKKVTSGEHKPVDICQATEQ